jgi:glycosyltransferase involved in cell wall biosynthesis
VLEALKDDRLKNEKVKYLLCGRANDKELTRIKKIIAEYQLEEIVHLSGFVPEKELTDHYLLADVFIMPSKKEGFGIVFIEALVCGLKVIAGNRDGSTEALMYGELGALIDPDSVRDIVAALAKSLGENSHQKMTLQEKTLEYFGFPVYKERLKQLLLAI